MPRKCKYALLHKQDFAEQTRSAPVTASSDRHTLTPVRSLPVMQRGRCGSRGSGLAPSDKVGGSKETCCVGLELEVSGQTRLTLRADDGEVLPVQHDTRQGSGPVWRPPAQPAEKGHSHSTSAPTSTPVPTPGFLRPSSRKWDLGFLWERLNPGRGEESSR